MRGSASITAVVRHATGIGLQAILVAAIVAALLLVLSPVYKPAGFIAGTKPVEAGHSRYAGAVSADPEMVHVGDYFDVVGCGYDLSLGSVVVTFTGGSWGSVLDAAGCFRIRNIPALSGDSLAPGSYEVFVHQKVGKRWRVAGETYVKVIP